MKNWKIRFPHWEGFYSDQEDKADTKASKRNGGVKIDATWTHWCKLCVQSTEWRHRKGVVPEDSKEKRALGPSLERRAGSRLAGSSLSSHLANQQTLCIQGLFRRKSFQPVSSAPAWGQVSKDSLTGQCHLGKGHWQAAKEMPQDGEGDLRKGKREKKKKLWRPSPVNKSQTFFFFFCHFEFVPC